MKQSILDLADQYNNTKNLGKRYTIWTTMNNYLSHLKDALGNPYNAEYNYQQHLQDSKAIEKMYDKINVKYLK